MYTKKLKSNIINNLLRKDKKSPNQHIYRDGWVVKNGLGELVEEIEHVTIFLINVTLGERIYCILNNITNQPKCGCGEIVLFKRYQLGYNEFCSPKCRANDKTWQKKVKETRIVKYGVEHYAQLECERKKRSEQMKKRQPSFDYSNAPDKRKETMLERYGKEYNSGWNEKAIQTRMNNGNMVNPELKEEYQLYYNKVVYVTSKQPLYVLENIHLRGTLGIDTNAHHVDHIYPIYMGFMDDISPEIIGHISNLQCIRGEDNITKGNNSPITKKQLFERYEQWN